MKREEAGGETAAISSVPAPHLPATPLPAPQNQLSPDFLFCPGAKIPFSRERGILGGGGVAWDLQAGLSEGAVSRGQCSVFVCYS